MRIIAALLLGIALFANSVLAPAAVEDNGSYARYYGTGTVDTSVLFTTGSLARVDACMLMTTTGSVIVQASLDGTNFSNTGLSLQDFGASTNDPVTSTVANRVYGFVGKYAKVRVLQNGATVAAASMNCWSYGA